MATSPFGVEQLPVEARVGLGLFFLAAFAIAIFMRNARADLAEAIRQDP